MPRVFIFNKINAVLSFYTAGRDTRIAQGKRIKEKKMDSKQSLFHRTANTAAASRMKFIF